MTATSATPSTLVLRRSTGAAVVWSALGVGLVAAGVFFVVDSGGHPVAWGALGLFVAVAAYFWVQLAVPGALCVRLGQDGLRARVVLRTVSVDWDDVQLVRVGRVFGDPTLVIDEHDGTRVRIPLPAGADTKALHRFLAARLGRPPDGRPSLGGSPDGRPSGDGAPSRTHTGSHRDAT